jgi:hypothetical protein
MYYVQRRKLLTICFFPIRVGSYFLYDLILFEQEIPVSAFQRHVPHTWYRTYRTWYEYMLRVRVLGAFWIE